MVGNEPMDQDIWQNILDKLEENIKPSTFRTWFYKTKLVDMNDSTLTIQVGTPFTAKYLNQNYTDVLSEISYAIYKKKYEVQFIPQKTSSTKEAKEKHDEYGNGVITNRSLNDRYSFEQFVVGKNNNFAYSAAYSVAEQPGSNYNPLFIYGESGMGKTHLMQAIGNWVMKNGRNYKIYYTTSEEFTIEMIESIRANRMSDFRNKFRKVDLLLVDDVHFLSKKEGTQEEFFHTFNTLFEQKKQIVLTSDRPPKDIPDLENRLVTRFESGLLADLKNPDFETRVAILRKKADPEKALISDEIINFIADNIRSSVRALEGSLIRILAYSSYNKLKPEEISPELARDILSDMISEMKKDITLDNITQQVCGYYGLKLHELVDKTRKQKIAFPRQVAMYLANLLIPSLSLKEIAEFYKRKDHTTVLHAKKMIENQFNEDNKFRAEIEELIHKIRG